MSGIARRDDGSSLRSDDGSLDDDGSVRAFGKVAAPIWEPALGATSHTTKGNGLLCR